MPVIKEGELEYEVEEILDFRKSSKGIRHLIHWKGYMVADHSWENEWYVDPLI